MNSTKKYVEVNIRYNSITKLHLFSPAKLNIGLSITGKRKDGYHLIESLFWPINFGDRIEIFWGERKSKSYFFVTYFDFFRGKKISHKNNTIIRTIELFPQFESLINKIFIKKKIPTQSGLGGGSSNAGTILRLIKNIFPYASIEKAAQEIGSDVSFFLNPVPTWVTGTGDKTKRLEIQTELFRKITFLLIFPPFGASTKNIFSLFKNKFSRSTNFFSKKKLTLRYFFKYLMVAKNDLEPIVINKFPFLAQVLEKLAETAPLFFSITGSGTTCFAIYESELKAKKSYKALYAFCRKNNCRSILAKTYTS